ncbi:hypothetical protein [Hyphobacterium sp.]|uniref:hypothetical protein n=1 Tax=Hyphobacterium sp. TaxID=2004662 RepID=UPI003BAC6586
MNDTRDPQDAKPTRSDVDDVADASFGVDTRIFRTVWDTFIFTPRVVEAAFSGDRKTYVPIIRLFLVLFGAQFAMMAFLGLPVGVTLDALETTPDMARAMESWLAEAGRSYDEVNRALEQAAALTTTPLTFIASAMYILLLKAYRPQRSFFGHALAYLAPVNASYIALFICIGIWFAAGFALGFSQEMMMAGFVFALTLSLVWYFVAAGRVIARFYAKSVIVTILQVLGLFLMLIPMLIVLVIGQYGVAEIVLRAGFDLSLGDLFLASVEAPEGNAP